MTEPDELVARFDALLGQQGRQVLAELHGRDVRGGAALRLGTQLRHRYPEQLVRDALGLHELRGQAATKFERAHDMFFTRAGLEQASAEVVARHRAARYAGSADVADLCCGIGGDLVALAPGRRVRAVDRDPLHLWMAVQNASVHGVAENVATDHDDVRDVDLRGVDAVFVDPARRSAHGRLRAGDSEPPLDWCTALTGQVQHVGIKAAPGIAHDAVAPGWELEFVSVGRELKEAVAWSPVMATAGTRATVLPAGHTLVPGQDEPVVVREPGAFLLDPDPAVTRAGVVEELARSVGAWKIDERIAFLSTHSAVTTPFARTLQVIDSAPWHQKQLPKRLRSLDIGAVDIRRRGLAGDVDALRRQLKLSGSRRATLVMTRVRDRPWALVCVEATTSE